MEGSPATGPGPTSGQLVLTPATNPLDFYLNVSRDEVYKFEHVNKKITLTENKILSYIF